MNFFSHKKSVSSEKDIEHGGASQSTTTPAEPQLHLPHTGRPELDPTDHLNLFRHLVGITSHESMFHAHFESGGRPAANLGIYARVVHNEADAKKGYKYFSWLINGCLGLQIVVAASLTAMGAGGARRSLVTVFGAINTVIAGILTFLKGSGLPNRLKYYQMEWRRVREFIEQRERDFSQPGNDLDLYAVVAMVEALYDEVKHDLDVSTPERFSGAGAARKSPQQIEPAKGHAPGGIAIPRVGDKLKELESGFGRVNQDINDRVKHVQSEAESGIVRVESEFEEKVKNLATKAQTVVQDFEKQRHGVEDMGRDVRDYVGRIGGPIDIHLGRGAHGAPSTITDRH